MLQARNSELADELARMCEETETERKQLEDELEEVLEELSVLERQEQLHGEAIQSLTGQKHTLGEELAGACAGLER